MQDGIFRGKLTLAVAGAFLIWGLAGASGMLLGGAPLAPHDGHYVLSDHGQLTDVSYGVWVAARVCRFAIFAGWVVIVAAMVALFVRKGVVGEDDPGRDYSRLVGGAVLLSLLLQLAASAVVALRG